MVIQCYVGPAVLLLPLGPTTWLNAAGGSGGAGMSKVAPLTHWGRDSGYWLEMSALLHLSFQRDSPDFFLWQLWALRRVKMQVAKPLWAST